MYAPSAMPPPLPPITESHGMPDLHRAVHFHRGATQSRPDGRPVDRVIGTPPHDYSQYTVADWQQVKATYYGMVSLVDATVGRIVTALDQHGLRDNTIIVFLSDHGDYLGDHGFYGKGLPYDSVLRTPVICAGPSIVANRHVTDMATTLDLAPTLLDFAQLAEPEGMQGVSMKAALQGKEEMYRKVVLTENDDDFVPMRMRTVTTTRWKLTYYLGQQMGELIDREADPDEMNNLWENPAYSDVKQALLQSLFEMTLGSIETANGRRQVPAPPVSKW
jgi:arylsulfatase A-like enzyme